MAYALENKERNKMIAIKVLNGSSASSVGKEYGISASRVTQISFYVCLRAVKKKKLHDKLQENWFYLRNARKYKDLLINAIVDS
jgi:DNA-directed RNA polymerase specialized sigma subunit